MFKNKIWNFISWFIRMFLLLIIFFGVFLTVKMFLVLILVSLILGGLFTERDDTIDYIAEGRDDCRAELKKLKEEFPKKLLEAKKPLNHYHLNEVEYEKYKKWCDTLPKGTQTEIILSSSSGIGISVTGRSIDGKDSIDLTDYSSW